MNIPKIIHYCWFGGNALPDSAIKCIESWKKYFPGYEIKEWNEKNYDVKKNRYIAEAYEAKKYAFVSDYARFDILYQYGGIYFDTDVEVIRSFEDILQKGAFMGCEENVSIQNERNLINPGLGMAAPSGLKIYKEILEFYDNQKFVNKDGTVNLETVVTKTTKILYEHGLENKNDLQEIEGITIYPQEYFNPKDSSTGELIMTKNTHSIHWYSMTWLPPYQKLRKKILDPFRRIFGVNCFAWLKRNK